MSQFMYLFRGGHDNSQSPEELQAEMQQWGVWMQDLGNKGILIAGEPLHKEGRVVKNNGSFLVTDGPFTEGKEVVGGYLLINADSFDEAVELSKDCPIFKGGGFVEVREIQKFEI